MVRVFVGGTNGFLKVVVSAIVLIVWHYFFGGDLASEVVSSRNTDVHKGFRLFEEVSANHVSALIGSAHATVLTVSVLNRVIGTLYGLKSCFTVSSNSANPSL